MSDLIEARDLIEAVAEAIYNTYRGDDEAWLSLYNNSRVEWLKIAQAALDAVTATHTIVERDDERLEKIETTSD